MIHVGALANLALQKFKAGTISIWQRRGSGLVLGSVWCGVLAASLPHGTDTSGTTGKALPGCSEPSVTSSLGSSHNPAVNNQGQRLGRNTPLLCLLCLP